MIWKCNLCRQTKVYKTEGWMARHLVREHRKKYYPKDQSVKSAFHIAQECRIYQEKDTK